MPSVTPSIIVYFPFFFNSYNLPSIVFSCSLKNGLTPLLQIIEARGESGCSSARVKSTLKVIQVNLLKKRRRKGVPTSAAEKIIQQVRYLMSSSLSVLSSARKERQAGMRQQMREVSMEWVLRMGLRSSRATKAAKTRTLGLILYCSSMNRRDWMRSKGVNLRGSIHLFRQSINYKITSIRLP